MRIAILSDRGAAARRAALLAGAAHLLHEWGAEADLVAPSQGRVSIAHDLHVLAGEADATLEHAEAIAGAGGMLLDSVEAARAMRERRATVDRIAAAGVPVLTSAWPGVVATHTLDHVGGQVFGTRLTRAARGLPTAVTVGAELRRVALRCAEILGVALLSVDVAAPDGRVAVVEVRAFPWLRGVPDAELRLADFVYASAFRLPVAGARARASLP